MHLFQQECQARGLCDEQGTRLENVDWRIVIASTSAPYSTDGGAVGITGVASQDGHRLSPPNLRTVGICRVTSDGLDFVVKRTSHSAQALLTNPVSMLHSKGQFLVGHSAEQWRFEGSHCTELTWTADEILQLVPKFTLTSFLGSHRLLKQEQQQLEQEQANTATRDKEHNTTAAQVSANRVALGSSKSHLVELIQMARMDLERGDIISLGDELKECVRPLRLLPERVECMLASPDASIMWDRWEWLRRGQKDKNNSDDWFNPQQLVPH